MIERPRNQGATGFGKRGTVTMSRVRPSEQGRDAARDPHAAREPSGTFNLPKWAIGAVAGGFLLLLVTMSGGIGGGGFLGGLLGGLIASKMMNSGSKTAAPMPPRPATAPHAMPSGAAAPATASAPAQNAVSRGGFGTTASSPSHSSGFSFGG